MEKLLIVDDSSELRKIIMLTFSYGKYKLLEAENGLQALALAESELPEIIVLDIMMPGMDGFEVCRRIKSNPRLAKTFVIMLTVLGQRTEREEGLEAGADYYMVKPFRPTDLIMAVEGVRTGKKAG